MEYYPEEILQKKRRKKKERKKNHKFNQRIILNLFNYFLIY